MQRQVGAAGTAARAVMVGDATMNFYGTTMVVAGDAGFQVAMYSQSPTRRGPRRDPL